MWVTPALVTAASMRSASATVFPSGFSQKTALPARAAAMAISACESPGVLTSTRSMSLRLTTSSQSVAASSQPYSRAAARTLAGVRPQSTFKRLAGRRQKKTVRRRAKRVQKKPDKRQPTSAAHMADKTHPNSAQQKKDQPQTNTVQHRTDRPQTNTVQHRTDRPQTNT